MAGCVRHDPALALVAACSSPSPAQRLDAAELEALAPLKRQYAGVVMRLRH